MIVAMTFPFPESREASWMMLMTAGLLDWRAEDSAHFGRRPLAMRHRAHLSPLFSDAALIRLIDATPREKIHVNTMPRAVRDPRLWREGDLGGLSGARVMEAVAERKTRLVPYRSAAQPEAGMKTAWARR